MNILIDMRRVRSLNNRAIKTGPVVYWMSRDQRVNDNWALLFALKLALERQQPLVVFFCLVPVFLEGTFRQYSFMLEGLKEVASNLRILNIPFFMELGEPEEKLSAFIHRYGIGALVTDFDPLKIKRKWKEKIAVGCPVAFYEVDAHNIVPCWQASTVPEFSARTFRPRINKLLDSFLTDFPGIKPFPYRWPFSETSPEIDLKKIESFLKVSRNVGKISWLKPGEKEARKVLQQFIRNKLRFYSEKRNDPNAGVQSNLSPYLHFGHIAAQRIAFLIRKQASLQQISDSFLEQLIVRKELADNYCYYNICYDSFSGFPRWARESLEKHRHDLREHLYTREEFEAGVTHDPLWNAAQKEMIEKGKMHGYMRMYWAKKILEWSKEPEEALETAIYLNNRYELDGRDPNGYAGIAWSIGGVHDRPWFERPVFGKIRYMTAGGARSKFNVRQYMEQFI